MKPNPKLARALAWAAALAVILIGWEFLGRAGQNGLLVSTPSRTFHYMVTEADELLSAVGQTSLEASAGLALAILASFAAIFACLYFPRLLGLLVPPAAVAQVIPLVSLAPLFIILFENGPLSKILMATLVCVFPIFIAFATGVRQVPAEIRTMLYLCNARPWQRIRWAYLPLSLPHLFSGLKVASTLAVIGAIVAEFNGADVGLGKNLYLAAKKLEPEKMMSSLILSSLLGGALYGLIVLAERYWGKWYINRDPL